MAKINFGWLKDKKGERFAPKTLISKVLDKNGKSLEKILEEMKRYSGNSDGESGLNPEQLQEAINSALAQAKASGDFKGAKGDKGDKGEVGIVWKGEWVENGTDGKGYKENDVVLYEGKLYIALYDNTIENPLLDRLDWGLFLPKGTDGKTPQKGTDYFTEADKAELVTDVLNALPTWQGGAY